MKPAVALLALALVAPDAARAGCSCEAVYVMPHVVYQVGIFGGHCAVPSKDLLMARGRALVLEQHVSELVERGELPDRELHISFTDDWSRHWEPFAVSRNSHALFIEGSTALDDRNLLRAIAYFGSPRWRSFHPDASRDRARNEELARRFALILDREVGEPDLARFQARSVTVFQVGDRYLLQIGASVVAIEEGVVVAGHPLPQRPANLGDCWYVGRPEAHAKWVNFRCASRNSVLLTYSLETNRFMEVDVPLPSPAYRRQKWLLGPALFVSDCG